MVMLSIIRNLCSIIGTLALFAFFYYWFKRYLAYRKAGENYQSDEQYLKYKKLRRISGIICLVGLIIGGSIPLSAEEKAEEEQRKIVREAKKEQDKTAQAQRDADAMFKKLDAITAENAGAKKVPAGFTIGGESCIFCGEGSIYTFNGEIEDNLISGKEREKLYQEKCKKSSDGHHNVKSWYERYYYVNNNRWYEGTKNITRNKDLYIQCLLKQ